MSNMDISNRNLKTLKGQDIPDTINGVFSCRGNQLKSLEFGPKEVESDYVCTNNFLTSIEFCATEIGGSLYINNNIITNLKDVHKQFKNGYIAGILKIDLNPLKSHLLGVILIPKLQGVFIDNEEAEVILEKHLKTGDVLDCQEELIQNGLKEFAQL